MWEFTEKDAPIDTERHTYQEWQELGRQVKKGQRRGADGRFSFDQTKAAGRRGAAHLCPMRVPDQLGRLLWQV